MKNFFFIFQEQSNRISDLEEERVKLKEQINELIQKIESLEGESVTDVVQSRLELKIKELESKLELEQTTRGRMETQVSILQKLFSVLQKLFSCKFTKSDFRSIIWFVKSSLIIVSQDLKSDTPIDFLLGVAFLTFELNFFYI